jgi:GT2 family glycosyltransferase
VNPVLMLTHDNLELTKKAIESVFSQRLRNVSLWVHDNHSTDGTVGWLQECGICTYFAETNEGVSHPWNRGLEFFFDKAKSHYDHVLVINNDVILPEWFYAELLTYKVPFVTGIAVDDMEAIRNPAEVMPLSPTPDFSAFLIHREAWEKIGPFNERMMLYSSDQDYHVRGHRLGVPMAKANVPYFHQRSSTLNNASPQEQAVIRAQADADRATFKSIYGCNAGGPEYEKLFLPVEA